MTDDAIREDGLSEEAEEATSGDERAAAPEEKQEEIKDPRLAEMERIATSHRDTQEEKEAELLGTSEEEVEAESEEGEKPADPVFQKDGVWMTRAKVNGEELEVPIDDMKTRYQKDTAAEKRLEEAAEKMRQVELREQQLYAYEQQLRQQPSSDAAGSAPSDNDAQNDAIKKAVEAIYSGEEDAAQQALQDAIASSGRDQEQVATPEQIVAEVENRIAARNAEHDRVRAVQKFQQEYPEIAKDQDLWEIADRHTIRVYEENPDATMTEIILEAGKRTREWYGYKSPAKTAKAEKKRKAASDSVSGVNARASLGEDDPRPLTPSEIIEEMRSARVQ